PRHRGRHRRGRADPQAGRARSRPGDPRTAARSAGPRGRRAAPRRRRAAGPAGAGPSSRPRSRPRAGRPAPAPRPPAPPPPPRTARACRNRPPGAGTLPPRRMVESLQPAAQLPRVVEADVPAIPRLRKRPKADFEAREGVKLSSLPFFALATLEALKVHPKL